MIQSNKRSGTISITLYDDGEDLLSSSEFCQRKWNSVAGIFTIFMKSLRDKRSVVIEPNCKLLNHY